MFARLVVVPELDQHPSAAIARYLRLGERDCPRPFLAKAARAAPAAPGVEARDRRFDMARAKGAAPAAVRRHRRIADEDDLRSEEHTSELQSLMRHSYPVFC